MCMEACGWGNSRKQLAREHPSATTLAGPRFSHLCQCTGLFCGWFSLLVPAHSMLTPTVPRRASICLFISRTVSCISGSLCILLAAVGLPNRMVSPSTFTSKPLPPLQGLDWSLTAVSTTLRSLRASRQEVVRHNPLYQLSNTWKDRGDNTYNAMGEPLTDMKTSPSFMPRSPGVSAVTFFGSNLGVASGA